MLRSVIFLSTPTSANGSLFRALTAIGQGVYEPRPWVNELASTGRLEEITRSVPPREGCLIKHNAPERFNPDTCLADYRFVLNARDPRDMVCNQYAWQFSHPFPNETEAEAAARKQHVAEAGIDAFALRQDNSPYLDRFRALAERITPTDRIFIGYAMYCLHFDEVTARLCAFLGVPAEALGRKQRKMLNRERVENLDTNRVWIGQIWPGADRAPGRHRQELRPETIRILTERHAGFLDWLRAMDDPRVAATYD
ncbi:MAG: hypothetical protein WCP77_21635 [Roseococcus sp.]